MAGCPTLFIWGHQNVIYKVKFDKLNIVTSDRSLWWRSPQRSCDPVWAYHGPLSVRLSPSSSRCWRWSAPWWCPSTCCWRSCRHRRRHWDCCPSCCLQDKKLSSLYDEPPDTEPALHRKGQLGASEASISNFLFLSSYPAIISPYNTDQGDREIVCN